MKLILPCCGRSSRYPNQPPKYLLPGHDGRPMLALAISRLAVSLDDVVVAILRDHEDKYQVTRGFERAFGRALNVVIHDEPTRSQSETVALTLDKAHITESFLVKDSDNCFALDEVDSATNYVSVESLNHFDSINPRNKSYVQVDHRGLVTNIREKVVISDLFSVGGYFFTSPPAFMHTYQQLSAGAASWNRELYLSDIIAAMILDGTPFKAREVTAYEDWGTVHEWKRALLARRAYVVALDGFVFERGSAHFAPRFDEVKANVRTVEALTALAAQGHSILYLSIRDQSLSALTQAQLKAAGAPEGTVTYGCPVAAMTLVSAPHATLPFLTVSSLEVPTTDDNLLEKLRDH